jgi:hypothetical protein
VVGVLGQYADAPVGLSIRFNTLYGPFCGTLPFAIGFLLSGRTPGPRWFGIGVVILAVGYALHFTEVFHFWRTYDSYPLKHFDFSTWLLGLGLAMIGLSNRPFPGRDWLARYGRIALIGHYLHAAWWEVGQVIFVLVMAILVVRLLMRSRLLRQFVS